MSKQYDDAKYGVERTLYFPTATLSAAAANVGSYYATEDILITEIGLMCSTAVSGGPGTCSIVLKEGSTVLGTLTIPTGTAAGSVVRTTTLTGNAISNTDTLIIATLLTTTAGAGTPYLKYKSRF